MSVRCRSDHVAALAIGYGRSHLFCGFLTRSTSQTFRMWSFNLCSPLSLPEAVQEGLALVLRGVGIDVEKQAHVLPGLIAMGCQLLSEGQRQMLTCHSH